MAFMRWIPVPSGHQRNIPATRVLEFSVYRKEQRKMPPKLRWPKVTQKHRAPSLRGALRDEVGAELVQQSHARGAADCGERSEVAGFH
jgi:hypothetical protein